MADVEEDAPQSRDHERTKAYRRPPMWMVLTEALKRLDLLEAEQPPVRMEARRP